MKFLLVAVNAKYIHSNPAIYSLKAYANKHGQYGDCVELAEYTINMLQDSILKDIYLRKPDVLGLSCYIWNIEMIQKITENIHKIMPEIPIWLGGPEVSFDCEKRLLNMPWIAGIMFGEGEEIFTNLLAWYQKQNIEEGKGNEEEGKDNAEEGKDNAEQGKDNSEQGKDNAEQGKDNAEQGKDNAEQGKDNAEERKDNAEERKDNAEEGKNSVKKKTEQIEDKGLELIDGLAYRKPDGRITINKPQAIMDLSSVPFLYDNWDNWDNRIIYYETSRGCPYRCSYCLSSVDKQVRFRNTEIVKKELKLFLEKRVPQVKLADRTFNAKKLHGMEIWRYIQENDNGVTNFHFEVTAAQIDEEELALLQKMRPGLVQLEIGVQTTNPQTAKAICRNASFEKISKVVKKINGFQNIHQHLDLIAGLPYENYESFGCSFNDVYALRPEQLQLGFLKVLKGSPMERQTSQYGIQYQSQAPYEVLATKWLSYRDIIRLKAIEEMTEVYYNSEQFTLTIQYLETKFSSAFALYEALADYYEKNKLFEKKHTRMARYDILRQFALCIDKSEETVYNNLLTYDCYLREKVKSRPAFAPDRALYKEWIRSFYKDEEKERNYLQEYAEYNSRQMEHMTQLEIFDIDVKAFEKEKRIIEKKTAILFNYGSKDPLNGNAKTIKPDEYWKINRKR